MAGRYGLEIRSATAVEAAPLAVLLAEGGITVSPHALAERLEAVRRQPGVVLIAGEWGPLSGVAALHWVRSLHADAPIARLDLLLVSLPERRRGVGRLLLKAGAQAARSAGCDRLELNAPAGARDLEAFCAATGFSLEGSEHVRPLRKKG